MKNNLELYISSAAFQDISKVFTFCKKNQVGLEISRFTNPEFADNITEGELLDIREWLNKLDNKRPIQHGPFFDLNPVSLDPKIIEIFNLRAEQALRIGKIIDSRTIIFHSGYNAQVKMDYYKKKFIEKQIIYWTDFIKTQDIGNSTIVLENTYEDDPQILKEICDGVDSDRFKTCLDIGHINVYSNRSYQYWFKVLDKHLCHFHLHNNNGMKDQHLSILNGIEDFQSLLSDLMKTNKNLTLTLEMFSPNDLIESLDFIRKQYSLDFQTV